jgi:hypothetical protein
MTSNLQIDLKIRDIEDFLNYLIDQIVEINVQSIQVIQTKQKWDVDLYYMKVNDL